MDWYDPRSPEVHEDPYPVYRNLRAREPAQYNPFARMWFLSRHADCGAVLRDPHASSRLGQRARQGRSAMPTSMLTSDPPEHARLREPVSRALNGGLLERARAAIAAAAGAAAGELAAAGSGDVIGGLARPVAAVALGRVLGVAPEELEAFERATAEASPILDPLADPAAVERSAAGAAMLEARFERALDRPGQHEDLPGALAGVPRVEAVSACLLVAIGGYEPLVHAIGNGLLALLTHPSELARLRAEPSLRRAAVEELLRFDPPIQFVARVPFAHIDLSDTILPAGRPVVALLGAANRDPAAFARPEALDLSRRPNPHLAFGAGIHACPGAALARATLAATLDAVLQAVPRLALAGSEPPRAAGTVPRGVAALAVRA